jgi:tetratricopeptide (TPR) repeat protein
MNYKGLTDSCATLFGSPNECPTCHSTSRIGRGLCLHCLLQIAVSDEETDEGLNFVAVLNSLAVSSSNWRLGNYEVLEEIGRGGMGVIYRARQRHSRRIVALKRVLNYHADSRDTLARFRREAEAAASLDHPNILPIYEVGESEDNIPFFSMKYASGGSFQEVGPALRDDPREIVRLMAKVTRAVQYAHRQGILHRDLKPGNVLLDSHGEPLVSDFGLAKWLDTSGDLTQTLTIFGTPGYIAPEQAEGPAANLKPSADVYSLGAILFDLLSGRPPFLGEHALAVIRQASEKPAPKLRSLVKGAGKDLETICASCLEREPTARYRSAGDLAEDLERWLEGRPIVTRPVSPGIHVWRWARRSPTLAIAAAAVILLAGTLFVVQAKRQHLRKTLVAESIYRRSVVMLPLLDLDKASGDQKFTRSLSDALQIEVSQFGPSRILPVADSKFLFSGVGTPDDVRAITSGAGTRTALIGTLRKVDEKLSVVLRLFDTSADKPLWQRRFVLDRSPSSMTHLAALAAGELSGALDGEHLGERSSPDPVLSNPTASEEFRLGQAFEQRFTPRDLDAALSVYLKAIDLAPKSALVRADFAIAAVNRSWMNHDGVRSPGPQLMAKAEAIAKEAIHLESATGKTRRALALVYQVKGDSLKTREQILVAIEMSGLQGSAAFLGNTLQEMGRPDLAVKWYQIAKHWRLPPATIEGYALADHFIDGETKSLSLDESIGDCWADLCEDRRAEEAYERSAAVHPNLGEWQSSCRLRLLQRDFGSARRTCEDHVNRNPKVSFSLDLQITAQVLFFSRQYAEAEKSYDELAKMHSGGRGYFSGAVSYQSALGCLSMVKGEETSGRRILEECLRNEKATLVRMPKDRRVLYSLAAIESSLGETEPAIAYLRRAYENGWVDYRSMELDPRFDSIRSDTPYRQITDSMTSRVTALRVALVRELSEQE